MINQIRKIQTKDIPHLKKVLDSSGLFPSDLLDDMISDFLNNEASTDIWLTTIKEGIPVSIAYCAPERMTEGTYNLYAIAVDKTQQGNGIGAEMMGYLEGMLKKQGHRILLVETSGLAEYELTRKFYHKCNYHQEAIIRDFYQEGEDKVVFWKKLN